MTSGDSHDPYLAFRYPAYRLFAASFVLAVIGSQVFGTAVQWEVHKRTGSTLAMGWLGLINAVPIFLLALPAGHVADSFSRKRVLLVTQFFLVAIPWLFAVGSGWSLFWKSLWLPFSLVALNAITLTFARPTRAALLMKLVPREVYGSVINWNSSLFETSAWIGPAIGGLLIGFGSTTTAYVVAGLSLLLCLILTLFLPDQGPPAQREPMTWKSVGAGLRFVFSRQLLWASMSLDLLAVLLGGATYLLPVFAEQRLHAGPVAFGILKAAPAIGAASMAIVQAHRRPFQKTGRVMLWAVVGFGLATIGFGLSTNMWISVGMLLIIGACDNISVVIRHTLVQTLTPDAMRGRVAAVNQVFIGASNELGGFESGLAAYLFGPVLAVVGGGAGAILVTLVIAGIAPQLRRLKTTTLHQAAQTPT